MKKIQGVLILTTAVVAMSLGLGGCHTVSGFGQDATVAGESVTQAAQATQAKIKRYYRKTRHTQTTTDSSATSANTSNANASMNGASSTPGYYTDH